MVTTAAEEATPQVMAGVDPSVWDDSGGGGGGYRGLGLPRTAEAAAPAAAGLPAEEPPAQGSGGGLSVLGSSWTAVAAAVVVAEPLTVTPDYDSDQGQGDAEDDQLRTAEGGPPDDGDPSDNEEDNTTDNDSETAQDPSLRANEIKRELLANVTLVPIVYRPPRTQNTEHLHPSIRRRRKYAVTQRRWLKDRGAVARDILDGKDPLAVAAPPEGTRDFWLNLFGRPSPPFPKRFPVER